MSNFVKIGQTVADIWKFSDFFKMAAVSHLGFVGGTFWDHPLRVLVGLYHLTKFGWNTCVVS